MQIAIREAKGIEPLVNVLQENSNNAAIQLNVLGALTEICRRCRKSTTFALLEQS